MGLQAVLFLEDEPLDTFVGYQLTKVSEDVWFKEIHCNLFMLDYFWAIMVEGSPTRDLTVNMGKP